MRMQAYLLVPMLLLLSPFETRAQVLFRDDFNSPRLGQAGNGNWRVADGVLRSEQDGCCTISSNVWDVLGDQSWQSYQVDFDIQFPTNSGQFFFGSQFDLAEMNRSSESMAPFPVGFQATIAVSGG